MLRDNSLQQTQASLYNTANSLKRVYSHTVGSPPILKFERLHNGALRCKAVSCERGGLSLLKAYSGTFASLQNIFVPDVDVLWTLDENWMEEPEFDWEENLIAKPPPDINCDHAPSEVPQNIETCLAVDVTSFGEIIFIL